MACSKTAFIEFKDCESSYLFEVELTPSTLYFYEITDKFGNVYQKAFTTDEDGYFSISPNDFPPYLLTNAGGNFTLIIKESLTDCSVVDFDYCADTFDTIVFSFIKNTDNGNVPVVDKCQKVYDCLGISENGSESKYLNEKGVFETPSGGGFSQVQADWDQTDNTEVDFIKNKPSIPSISGLATENYVDTEVSSAISSANGYTDNVSSSKVDKVTGYGLSKNDLTDLLKSTYDGYASQISAKANKSDTICLIAKIQTTYTITGTTSETPFTSLMIPANTFSSGDRVILDAMFLKTGGVGTTVSSFRISTSSSVSPITNATLMAKTPAAIAATTIYPLIRNYIKIDSPTSTIMPPASGGVYNDFSSFSSLSITNLNIDWTVDQYIYPTETLGNSADAVTLKYFAIYKG